MSAVLVTGANGFIGRHLGRTLEAGGCRTVGVSRNATQIDGYSKVHRASLGDSLEPLFEQEPFDAVVHCANYAGPGEFQRNVDGTSLWLEQASEHGVGLQVFLSSVSANAQALSDYGAAKFALEKRFLDANQVVLRLGLVIGAGGMFEKIRKPLGELRFVPLLDNGIPLVYVIGVDSLCLIIRDVVAGNAENLRGRTWQMHQEEPYRLRDVMRTIRRQFGYSCRFIPVPSLPVLWLLTLMERLPLISLPVSSTNVKGLRQNRNQRFQSDFARFGHPEMSLDALVAAARKAY
jgi:nucleoside-diphosphate-sugar epimerase